MPIFQRTNQTLKLIKPKNFSNEKELQHLIEINLEEIFNCKFIASEFSTGSLHGGRIDSLALSEENNPIIIEYKVVESSQLVNQSLFYLSWISDHHGDFEIAVQKALPDKNISVDWSDIRVICMAPEFKKYDLYAVKMMGANIELWQYKYYNNDILFIEEIYKKASIVSNNSDSSSGKNPIMVAAGKKAAITRSTGIYTKEEHLNKIEKRKKALLESILDFIINIDESIEEKPKKFYIAYKITQNFACVEVQKNKILLFLKINPTDLNEIPEIGRDVSNIGHYGTGNIELTIKNFSDFEISKEYIKMAFENIGGN